jgi:hypothetical protein
MTTPNRYSPGNVAVMNRPAELGFGVFRRTDQESKQRARLRAIVFGRHDFELRVETAR